MLAGFRALASDDDGEEEELPRPSPSHKQPRLSPSHPPGDSTLSFLTFNVLADHLCRPSWFPYRSKEELSWDTRKECLKRAILASDASVVCLQEVQTFVGPTNLSSNQNHFQWFDQFLREEGYSGVYASRTNYSGKEMPGVQLGNLVYFKTSQFEPIRSERSVSLLKTIHSCADKETRRLYCHSGVRGTVASFLALECRTSRRRVLVVTTHLPAPRSDTDYSSALEQALHGIALLREIAKFCTSTPVDAVVCAGDLNSLPGSTVVDLFRSGKVSASKVKRVLRLAEQSKFPPGFVSFETGAVCIPDVPLRWQAERKDEVNNVTSQVFFDNALSVNNPPGMAFTNKTNIFTGWLDHVFLLSAPGVVDRSSIRVEDSSLKCTEFLLPHPELGFGSDHLPVRCEMTFRGTRGSSDWQAWIKSPPEELELNQDEEEAFDYRVGDEQALAELLDGCSVLAFKLYGDLSRGSAKHPTSPLLIGVKRIDIKGAVLILDLKKHSWVIALLQPVLEDKSRVKLTFDCRVDSDVLFHNFSCTLHNVLDVQVYTQALRVALDESYEIRECTQSWFPMLPNLERVKTEFLPQAELEYLKRAKPPKNVSSAALLIENQVMLEFAASQLLSFDSLIVAMRSKAALSEELLTCLDCVSQSNCRRFRDRESAVDIVFDKRLILQEVSIKDPVPDGVETADKYANQWVELLKI